MDHWQIGPLVATPPVVGVKEKAGRGEKEKEEKKKSGVGKLNSERQPEEILEAQNPFQIQVIIVRPK